MRVRSARTKADEYIEAERVLAEQKLPPNRSRFRNAARINANSYPSPSIAG